MRSNKFEGDTFSLMLGILTDTQQAIVETIRMRLDTNQALKYLEDIGFAVSRATFFRQKKKVESLKLQRLYHMAKFGFEDQHLERIDKCELIEKLMWENYNNCKDPFRKVAILEKIIHIQPYLSAYYEATENVIKESDFMKQYYVPQFETSTNRNLIENRNM